MSKLPFTIIYSKAVLRLICIHISSTYILSDSKYVHEYLKCFSFQEKQTCFITAIKVSNKLFLTYLLKISKLCKATNKRTFFSINNKWKMIWITMFTLHMYTICLLIFYIIAFNMLSMNCAWWSERFCVTFIFLVIIH